LIPSAGNQWSVCVVELFEIWETSTQTKIKDYRKRPYIHGWALIRRIPLDMKFRGDVWLAFASRESPSAKSTVTMGEDMISNNSVARYGPGAFKERGCAGDFEFCCRFSIYKQNGLRSDIFVYNAMTV